MTNTQRRKTYTTGQVARLCEVSVPTVHRWLKEKSLAHFTLPGSRSIRIHRDELLRFMVATGFPPPEELDPRIKVLAIDDDAEILKVISRIFSDTSRFAMYMASTGFQAGFLAATHRVDVILLDIELPDVDGRDVATSIRRHGEDNGPVIVAVSGKITQAEVNSLPEQGFDDFVKKPFKPDSLISAVEKGYARRLRSNGTTHSHSS